MSETTMSEPLPDGVYCLTESKNRYVMDGETVARFRLALADVKRMHADAKLGAALRAAVETLHGGEAFHVRRYVTPQGATREVVVSGLHIRDGGSALSALQSAFAALLRPSPPEGPQE